jgi:antitoxin MazE
VRVRLARWGNSLGIRIPEDIAQRLGLVEGVEVDVDFLLDRIVVSRVQSHQRYALKDLLVGMTRDAMHKAYDWDHDRGHESVG